MRFLVDECVSRRIVERLRADGHDVRWIADTEPSNADGDILESSRAELRIVLTEDWDFGELAIRQGRPALGIVIVAMPQLARNAEHVAESVVRRLAEMEQRLQGKLTIMEAGRVRQRELAANTGVEDKIG